MKDQRRCSRHQTASRGGGCSAAVSTLPSRQARSPLRWEVNDATFYLSPRRRSPETQPRDSGTWGGVAAAAAEGVVLFRPQTVAHVPLSQECYTQIETAGPRQWNGTHGPDHLFVWVRSRASACSVYIHGCYAESGWNASAFMSFRSTYPHRAEQAETCGSVCLKQQRHADRQRYLESMSNERPKA